MVHVLYIVLVFHDFKLNESVENKDLKECIAFYKVVTVIHKNMKI